MNQGYPDDPVNAYHEADAYKFQKDMGYDNNANH
jgi:hypothetical protein